MSYFHLRPIEPPRCKICGEEATKQVWSIYDAPGGKYCDKCAEQTVRQLNGVVGP